jgi:two-component system, cell cycle sensor histidine kinase and response regulator CckA
MAHVDRSAHRSIRVLLADDEDLVRTTLRMILKGQGYHVVEAVNGEEAISKYMSASDAFDVLLLDLDMPGFGGEETFRRIKHQHPHAKAIFLTGGISGPANQPFLQKPFNNQELLRLVREVAET